MIKNPKKKGLDKYKVSIAFALIAVIVILLGFFMLKPSITGFAVVTKETTFSDNLNLIVNESKSVIWNLRNPGDIRTIRATGAITRNGSAKVYIENDNERVLIFDSTKQLFDVNVQVLPDYKRIFQGDEILIQIILFNLRGFGSADVNVKYSIKDPNGNIIATEEEIVTVETQAKFVRKLLIPTDLKPDAYVAFVEVETRDGLIGTSSDLFEVSAKFAEAYPRQLIFYALGLAVLIIVIIIIIISMRMYKRVKKKQRVIYIKHDIKQKIPTEKREKLEKELAALESAYKSKFISEASYNKDKQRVKKRLRKLKQDEKQNYSF